jgi:uncharacterized protein YciI
MERVDNLFVYRLIPPRPTFDQDMNDEERAIMGRHAEYWSGLMEAGRVVVYGPVRDSTGSWGLGVIRAESEEVARQIADDDPAVREGLATTDLGKMVVAIVPG